jgi:hypothetical protein
MKQVPKQRMPSARLSLLRTGRHSNNAMSWPGSGR